MNFRIFFALSTAAALVGGLSGCSTVINGKFQNIELTTQCGKTVVPAQCTLRNEHGEWKTSTPNQVVIQRGYGDLDITCAGDNFDVHRMRLKSRTSAATLLNVTNLSTLTMVDVGSGAGYEYPSKIQFNVAQCHYAEQR